MQCNLRLTISQGMPGDNKECFKRSCNDRMHYIQQKNREQLASSIKLLCVLLWFALGYSQSQAFITITLHVIILCFYCTTLIGLAAYFIWFGFFCLIDDVVSVRYPGKNLCKLSLCTICNVIVKTCIQSHMVLKNGKNRCKLQHQFSGQCYTTMGFHKYLKIYDFNPR